MGYPVKEVTDSKLSKDEINELTTFITQSSKFSKPFSYLYPEGKEKEKMI